MLYGLRDDKGNLIAISEKQVSPVWQAIDKNSEEALSFFGKMHNSASALVDSDMQFIRVLDDLLELLIEKQIIQFTELPEPAQDKLLKRRWYRQQLKGDDETVHLLDPQDRLL